MKIPSVTSYKRSYFKTGHLKRFFVLITAMFICWDETVWAKDQEDSCITCHSSQEVIITNKKLYTYLKAWDISIHKQEGVLCVDCHGGDPKSTKKDVAHGGKDSKKLLDPVRYENVLETCGKCHKENLKSYRKSNHYAFLMSDNKKYKPPNCITCHNSINTNVPTSATISALCQQCHNDTTKISTSVPEDAKTLMDSLAYANRFYRYLNAHGVKTGNPHFTKIIDAKFFLVAEAWHAFDISNIEKETTELRNLLKEKRKDMIKDEKNLGTVE